MGDDNLQKRCANTVRIRMPFNFINGGLVIKFYVLDRVSPVTLLGVFGIRNEPFALSKFEHRIDLNIEL